MLSLNIRLDQNLRPWNNIFENQYKIAAENYKETRVRIESYITGEQNLTQTIKGLTNKAER